MLECLFFFSSSTSWRTMVEVRGIRLTAHGSQPDPRKIVFGRLQNRQHIYPGSDWGLDKATWWTEGENQTRWTEIGETDAESSSSNDSEECWVNLLAWVSLSDTLPAWVLELNTEVLRHCYNRCKPSSGRDTMEEVSCDFHTICAHICYFTFLNACNSQ